MIVALISVKYNWKVNISISNTIRKVGSSKAIATNANGN